MQGSLSPSASSPFETISGSDIEPCPCGDPQEIAKDHPMESIEDKADSHETPVHINHAPIPYLPPINPGAPPLHGCPKDTAEVRHKQRAVLAAAGNITAQEEPYYAFGVPFYDLWTRYTLTQLKLLDGFEPLHRSIFILLDIYGKSQWSSSILETHGVLKAWALWEYREMCRTLCVWHKADEMAMLQVMRDIYARRFEHTAEAMMRKHGTARWSGDQVCEEWMKYQLLRDSEIEW